MPAVDKGKYAGHYQTQSRTLRDKWYANPATRCAICGRTHAEAVKLWGPERAAWDADHPEGRPDGPLRPTHARCNRSEGAARGNRQRKQFTTRQW